MCVFVLTKLLLSTQWVTCCPPQGCPCSYYVAWWLWPWGASLCFDTRQRWVPPWACTGSLPAQTVVSPSVMKRPISPSFVPLRCLVSKSSLTVSHLFTVTQSLKSGMSQGFMGTKCLFVCFYVASLHNIKYKSDRKTAAEKERRLIIKKITVEVQWKKIGKWKKERRGPEKDWQKL